MNSHSCPFCGHFTTTDSSSSTQFVCGHKTSSRALGAPGFYTEYRGPVVGIVFYECKNPACGEVAIDYFIGDGKTDSHARWEFTEVPEKRRLCPSSIARTLPDYIPGALKDDYREACEVIPASPKASAALSRRCLQGMIRDFWDVTDQRTLNNEIQAIKSKVSQEVWDAIDGVRQIGNIGAHMEKDVELIVDVDPNEAEALINLLEMLFDEWYIARAERQARLAVVTGIATEKRAA